MSGGQGRSTCDYLIEQDEAKHRGALIKSTETGAKNKYTSPHHEEHWDCAFWCVSKKVVWKVAANSWREKAVNLSLTFSHSDYIKLNIELNIFNITFRSSCPLPSFITASSKMFSTLITTFDCTFVHHICRGIEMQMFPVHNFPKPAFFFLKWIVHIFNNSLFVWPMCIDW